MDLLCKKSARKSSRVVIGALTHKKPDWDWCQSIREMHFQKTGSRHALFTFHSSDIAQSAANALVNRNCHRMMKLNSLKVSGTWRRFISPQAERPRRFLVQFSSTYGEWLLKIDLPHDDGRRWLKCLRWNFSANNPQNAFQRLSSHLLTFSSLHWLIREKRAKSIKLQKLHRDQIERRTTVCLLHERFEQNEHFLVFNICFYIPANFSCIFHLLCFTSIRVQFERLTDARTKQKMLFMFQVDVAYFCCRRAPSSKSLVDQN